MIINRIYETQNLLSLYLVSFLVGLTTYQHPCYFDDEDSCDDDDNNKNNMMIMMIIMLMTKIMIMTYCKLGYLIANSVRFLSSSFHLSFFLLRTGII
jgi:hypothetical protein